MDKQEWKRRYMNRLIECNVNRTHAEEIYETVFTDNRFYDLLPEYCADEELNDWDDSIIYKLES